MTADCQCDSRLSIVNGSRLGVDSSLRDGRVVSAAGCRTISRSPCPWKDALMTRRARPMDPDKSYAFTRPVRWPCGTFFSFYGKFEIVCYQDGVEVSKLRPYPLPAEWIVFTPCRKHPWRLLNGERAMASKFIKNAMTKKKAMRPGMLIPDMALCADRPAITDFMCDLEAANGGVREPSAIMISFNNDGVRAGLKDDDAGGWVWKQGKTLSEALDAIEKALQSDNPGFRQAQGYNKKKGK